MTWLTYGLRIGSVRSPPLACWNINTVKQCSLVLNNVWVGYSGGKRKEEPTFPILHFVCRLHWLQSNTNAHVHTHTHAHAHMHTVLQIRCLPKYDLDFIAQCAPLFIQPSLWFNELKRVLLMRWWHVSHKITPLSLALAAIHYISVSQMMWNGSVIIRTQHYQWIICANTDFCVNITDIWRDAR